MIEPTVPLVAVAGALSTVVAAYGGYRIGKWRGVAAGRTAAEREASREAHEDATDRAPPVDVGDNVSLGVKEFKTYHSGEQVAVCKKEGFVVFVESVPEHLSAGDVIEAEVTSFGRDRNSAEATYTG